MRTLPLATDDPAIPSPAVPMGSDDDRWIVARVRRAAAGDQAAFGELYQRTAGLVHGVLLARLPPSDVPDLVQEVFLLALRRLSTLRAPAAFLPWLCTLARRVAADRYRAGGRGREIALAGVAGPAVAPGLTADGLAVLQALSRLPGAFREPLVLRLVEGMSGREIAAATGLTEGSVRVNLSRGMKRLRAELAGGGPGRTSSPEGGRTS